jgi:ABC-type sugar transport system permease subunit
MPPTIVYHTKYARRDWGLFALFVAGAAFALGALGISMERDEVSAAHGRAEFVASALAERLAIAGATPGSDVAATLTPLAAAGAPDLQLAVLEEQPHGPFEYLAHAHYLGHSEVSRAGHDLDLHDAADRRVLELTMLAHNRHGAALVWSRGMLSAAATAPSGRVAATVEDLHPRAPSGRPRTIALVGFVMLVIFAAGTHDILPRTGRYLNLIVMVAGVFVVALLGQALEPSLWRGSTEDAIVQKAELLRLADFARVASQDLPAPVSAVARWGRWAASGGVAFYLVALTGVFHRVGRLVRREALAYRLAGPAFALIVPLGLVPLVASVGLSLLHAAPSGHAFVAFGNFVELGHFGASNPTSVWRLLAVDGLWVGVSAAVSVGVAIVLTLAVRAVSPFWRRVYRTLLVIPWGLPSYAASLFGLHALLGLSHRWPSLATATLTGTLFACVALLLLEDVPEDAIESLKLDGVTGWRRLRALELPLLRRLMVPAFALGSLLELGLFAVADVPNQGAPDGASDLLVTRAYRWAFQRHEYGLSAAWTCVALATTGVLMAVLHFALRARRTAPSENVSAAPVLTAEAA